MYMAVSSSQTSRKTSFAILQPLAADFHTNPPEVNLPGCKLLTLTSTNIFIQNVHAACRRLPIFSSNASLAKLTASAIASRLTLP